MSAIFGSPATQTSSSQNGSTSTSGNQSNNYGLNESSNLGLTQSSQFNQAYPMLANTLGSQVSNGTGASNDLSALLGVGGDPAAQQKAFQDWQNSTGYQFGLDQGSKAITGNAAARGLLNSGDTAKALDTYGQNYADTQYQNYLTPLMNLINSGNQAGGIVSGAGGVSQSSGITQGQSSGITQGQSNGFSNASSYGTSTGQSTGAKPGIGGLLGSIGAAVATGGASTLGSAAGKAGNALSGGAGLAAGTGLYGSGNGAD